MNLFAKPNSADLRRQLDNAKRQLQQLEADFGDIALASFNDDPAGSAGLSEHRARIAEAENQVEALAAALLAAERTERQQRAAGLAKVREGQLAKLKASLKRRDEAAARYAKAETERIAAFRDMIAGSIEAKACNPIGLDFPDAVARCHSSEVAASCLRETFRLGGQLAGDPNRSPVVAPGVPEWVMQVPRQQPELTAVMSAASKEAIRRLRDQIDTARIGTDQREALRHPEPAEHVNDASSPCPPGPPAVPKPAAAAKEEWNPAAWYDAHPEPPLTEEELREMETPTTAVAE